MKDWVHLFSLTPWSAQIIWKKIIWVVIVAKKLCLCFVKTLDVLECVYFSMIVSYKLNLDWRAVCGMLVNSNLSAWALVAVSLIIVKRKKLLREAVFVFFMPEKENSLELGSSWAILFGCRSYFLLGMVCIRDVCPGRGEQFHLLKEWITPRLSWHFPHLLPCCHAGWPAPDCPKLLSFQGVLPCHFILQMSCLAFFPMQSLFIPPLETTLWQCFQKACP